MMSNLNCGSSDSCSYLVNPSSVPICRKHLIEMLDDAEFVSGKLKEDFELLCWFDFGFLDHDNLVVVRQMLRRLSVVLCDPKTDPDDDYFLFCRIIFIILDDPAYTKGLNWQ